MVRTLLCLGLLLAGLSLAGGCYNVNAKAPENLMGSSSPPPTYVPPADRSSKADLLRENQQLRERIAWLEDEARKSAKKNNELTREKQEILADTKKIAAERDRYKRAAGY